MGTGAIVGSVDVAQLVLYAFWAFFFGLIYYLVRENHREGYPMETVGRGDLKVTGWPVPDPKTYRMADGSTVKGFVCEPAALDGAPDVSAFGGWRAYCESLDGGQQR